MSNQVSLTSLLMLLIVIFSEVGVIAQSETPGQFTSQVIPMAPNAASVSKFVDVPVSYYTGTPQISIPIYEAKAGSLSVPISINYHASGHRVDEVASWVGLGWSLDAGGTISRSIRGLADESPYGFFVKGYLMENPGSDCDDTNLLPCNFLMNASVNNLFDSEPDSYFLNLPGGGGVKFTFDYSGNVVMQNYQQTKITWNRTDQQWMVVTADGVQYLFGKSGKYGERDLVTVSPEEGASTTSISSWHLSEMISPDKVDTIFFEYANGSDISGEDLTQQIYYQRDVSGFAGNPYLLYCNDLPLANLNPGSTTIKQKALSKVIFSQGSVDFNASLASRKDVPGDRSLASINVKKRDGSLFKYFTLYQEFFGNEVDENYRLKLRKITEFAADGQSLQPYQFEYDEVLSLPKKGSYQQDHWGFYNNNTASILVPKQIDKGDGTFIYFSQGANRETDSARTKALMLNKITYPTGGYDVFDYEAHDIAAVGNQTATEFYTEVHNYSAKSSSSHNNESITATLVVGVPTSAMLSVGGGCKGLCGWAGSPGAENCEKASASVNFINHAFGGFQTGWGCLESSKVLRVTLNPGTYDIELHSEYLAPEVHSNSYLDITLYKQREVSFQTPPNVGGVRIKRISRYDGLSSTPKVTRYQYTTLKDGQAVTSGVLVRKPSYYFKHTGLGQVGDGLTVLCPYDAGASAPRISLGDGTHIGYREVKVLHGNQGENGFEIYKYTTAADFPDTGGDKFPNPPPDTRDNRRGLMKEHVVYDKYSNPVSQTINTYVQHTDNFYTYAKGLKIGMTLPRKNDRILSDYKWQYYYFWQEWQHPSTITERVYSSTHDGTFVETVTTNYYDRPANHVQLTREERKLDGGTTLKTLYKYPADYLAGGAGVTNINALYSAHIYAMPVEVQKWRTNNNVSRMISGSITDVEPSYFKPSKIYSFDSDTPVTTLDNETVTGNQYTSLLSDSKYKLRAEMSYQNGRVVSQFKNSDVRKSYVWGLKNSVPVMEVVNADPASVAYTSFEDTGSEGGWVFNFTNNVASNKTGNKSHLLSGYPVSRWTLNSATSYVVSYWAKGGTPSIVGGAGVQSNNDAVSAGADGWHYFEKSISGVNNIAISAAEPNVYIDELRLFPKGALVTTYTYDALNGMTSKTDQNNNTTYFEYDNFGRMSLTRDKDRNITKMYTYHYKIP